jgi:S-adenosylmethionine decarboxylase proenzyme
LDTLARHFLVELRGCRADLLNQPETVKDLLRRAATEAGATIVAEVVHAYSPHGVTGVVVIEESHLSLHTWPEKGYAAVDFYTCGKVAVERAVALLGKALGATSVETMVVERGRPPGKAPFHVLDREE